jgi:hypothetical protein
MDSRTTHGLDPRTGTNLVRRAKQRCCASYAAVVCICIMGSVSGEHCEGGFCTVVTPASLVRDTIRAPGLLLWKRASKCGMSPGLRCSRSCRVGLSGWRAQWFAVTSGAHVRPEAGSWPIEYNLSGTYMVTDHADGSSRDTLCGSKVVERTAVKPGTHARWLKLTPPRTPGTETDIISDWRRNLLLGYITMPAALNG